MTAHTDGPWEVHQQTPDRKHNSVRVCRMEPTKEGMCFTVAEAEILGVPRDEAEANARLIAAAPELLAACKAGGSYCNALKELQDENGGQIVDADTDELDRLFMDWHDKTHAAILKAEGRREGRMKDLIERVLSWLGLLSSECECHYCQSKRKGR